LPGANNISLLGITSRVKREVALEIPSVNSEHKSHLKKKTGKTLKYKKKSKTVES